MAKVLVSFKEKERELYELVNQQGDKSNFIKDALKFYLECKKEKSPVKTEAAVVGNYEIMDIISGA